MAYMDSYYVLSLNILKALGGDTSIVYPDADAIWDEINKIYNNAGNRFDIVPLEKNITENGQYDYYPDGDADAFMPVNINVNVPQKYTDEQVFEIESNAIQQGYNQGYVEGEADGKLTGREEGFTDGFNEGIEIQRGKLTTITITDNGVYTREDGYNEVTVEVEGGIPEDELQQMLQEAMDEGYQDGYAEGLDDGFDDGAEDQKAKLESITLKDNGTYTREDGWNSVTVQVEGSGGGDTGKPKIYNGFVLNPIDNSAIHMNNLKNIDFSQYDWSSVYDLSFFFANFNGNTNTYWADSYFESFDNNFNGKILSCQYMFNHGNGESPILYSIPSFLNNRMHDCLDMSYMFYKQLNLSLVSNIANWNTSNVITTSNMFYNCSKLTSVPLFDTSNVLDASNMFSGCTSLTSVPEFDFSKVTNFSFMFSGCTSLTSVPEFDFSNAKNLQAAFSNCTKLTELPNINCKNIMSFASNWLGKSMKKIGIIDCDSVRNANYILGANTNNTTLTDIGGFRNLGKVPALSNTNGNYVLYYFPNLTKESILNVLNLLYDRASAGYTVLTLKMHANHLAMLSDEEKAIATNKGWTLA